MKFEELNQKLLKFRGSGTSQSWKKNEGFLYKNEYIYLIRIDSSNQTGGSIINNGKQWSIIIDIKKSFTDLPNWRMLERYYEDDIKLTPVTHGKNLGKFGIRLYRMAYDPTNEIIRDLLDFIFNKKD
jgi:hypothetical protein